MTMIYIRTDKNGTKIYHDYTCPRCGGAGAADKWMFTGKTCWECGGTGKRAKPRTIKEYTDEYAAKLETKRIARQKKYEEEHADEIAEQKRRDEEWRKKDLERRYAENGCGKDGIGYVLNGNTYPIKDQIKANGGRWIYGVWVCPVEIKAKGVTPVRIDLTDALGNPNSETYAGDIIWDARS